MGRKEKKWLRPRASIATGDDEEGQQPARHRQGTTQRHGDGEAARMHDIERRRAAHWVKGERGSYTRARKKIREKWAPW